MRILLKNGRLIDYKTKNDEVTDILINDNKIEKIAKDINEKADRIIDCTNLNIIPGMIDMHCHLREPGFEYKETIETGAKSAVCGGFTTICPMPNTKPTPDSAIILQKIIAEGKRVNLCNILPFASVSKGEKGEELVDFDELKEAGAIGFSDDELINFYGLEQEQIDELRENDLEPWNFNEEELTPEDFYYHDVFYQDKIKRGKEKEEP